jgi:hypothetical protein
LRSQIGFFNYLDITSVSNGSNQIGFGFNLIRSEFKSEKIGFDPIRVQIKSRSNPIWPESALDLIWSEPNPNLIYPIWFESESDLSFIRKLKQCIIFWLTLNHAVLQRQHVKIQNTMFILQHNIILFINLNVFLYITSFTSMLLLLM